jgi:peptidoglycan hydrolase-like protein with peptidoglycan-binding domain
MSVIVSRSSPADDLALGDVGPAVLALQDDLRSLGAALSSDGAYSFDVERTVAGIQQFFELEANGRADAPTRALLQQLVDEAPAAV